ncbi:MAG: DUF58 domain-containing protein [Oscillospiraceae bacterium]|nr:DUF58 domain-containing protein [Oscillospiraceae bacterium]
MEKQRQGGVSAMLTRIIGYLIAMGITVFFSLYMSAQTGWIFFYVLAAAPVFSLIITLITYISKFVEVSADVSSNMVYKSEEFFLRVKVRNKSILPVPAVIVKISEYEGFETDKRTEYSVSVSPRSETSFEVRFKALMWGAEEIGIEEISMMDFLHLVKLPIYKGKKRSSASYSCVVKVFPNIPDVPSDMPLIRNAAETIRFSDESEDTKENNGLNLFGSMPGYTHREYAPGDPVKRINWKLSSKRDVYMVRLDDEAEAMRQIIVLDSVGSSRAYNERAVEGVLAIAFSLFRLGFESTVWYNTRDGFVSADIKDFGDISALQTAFADYSFITLEKAAERIPISTISSEGKGGGIILFTPSPDYAIAAEADAAYRSGEGFTAVVAGEASPAVSPCWIMAEDYTAEYIS